MQASAVQCQSHSYYWERFFFFFLKSRKKTFRKKLFFDHQLVHVKSWQTGQAVPQREADQVSFVIIQPGLKSLIIYLQQEKWSTAVCRSLSLQHHRSQTVWKKYRKFTSFRNIAHPTSAQKHTEVRNISSWVKELILWISQCVLHIASKKLHSLKRLNFPTKTEYLSPDSNFPSSSPVLKYLRE